MIPFRSQRKSGSLGEDNYLTHFADRILELGNLGFSVLVFGQAFHEEMNLILLIGGIVFLFTAYLIAYMILKKKGGK